MRACACKEPKAGSFCARDSWVSETRKGSVSCGGGCRLSRRPELFNLFPAHGCPRRRACGRARWIRRTNAVRHRHHATARSSACRFGHAGTLPHGHGPGCRVGSVKNMVGFPRNGYQRLLVYMLFPGRLVSRAIPLEIFPPFSPSFFSPLRCKAAAPRRW
jgi:hypothetical protein